jgi:hypothetical protein
MAKTSPQLGPPLPQHCARIPDDPQPALNAGPCPFKVPATVKPKLAQALLLAAVGSRCGVADTAKKTGS